MADERSTELRSLLNERNQGRRDFLAYSLAIRQACRVARETLKQSNPRLHKVATALLTELTHEEAGELMRLAVVELLQMPGTPIRPQALDLGAVNASHVADSIKALKG